MNQAVFEDRVKAIEWMLSYAGPLPHLIQNKRLVEIGSGFGCGAIACIRNQAAEYLGIEPSPFGSEIIRLEGTDPGYRREYEKASILIDKKRVRFFEGYAEDWPGSDFDICLLADMLEHVADPIMITNAAYRLLKVGGCVIASTGPLYYSATGHHLFEPFRDQPWAHLREDFEEKIASKVHSNYLLNEFRNLNRVTHSQLVSSFERSGFIILKSRAIAQKNYNFHEYKHLIDRTIMNNFEENVFCEDVSQIVAIKAD